MLSGGTVGHAYAVEIRWRLKDFRIKLHGLFIVFYACFESSLLEQGQAEVEMDCGIVGIKTRGLRQMVRGFFVSSLFPQYDAEPVV